MDLATPTRCVPRSKRAAFIGTLVEAGAPVWRKDEIEQRMVDEYAKQPVGLLYRLFGPEAYMANLALSACVGAGAFLLLHRFADNLHSQGGSAFGALCISVVAFLIIQSKLCYEPEEWRRNPVALFDGSYRRNNSVFLLPDEALALAQRIAKVLPNASFDVSFIGFDPILWCTCFDGKESHKAAMYVWDEVDGKNIPVLPPH